MRRLLIGINKLLKEDIFIRARLLSSISRARTILDIILLLKYSILSDNYFSP